jgi:hypothetical protein
MAFPQGIKSDKKLTRQEKKEQRMQEQEAAEAKIKEMVTNSEWVLEVTALMDERNNHSFLNTSNNFVAVNQLNGVVQLTLPNTRGWNGIGGTTLRGKVENYDVNDSGKLMYVTGTIFTNQGAFTFRLYPSSHKTKIVLSGPFNDTITLIGNLISPDETVLFEGINIY